MTRGAYGVDPVLDRRSIRKYTADPVPEELVERLLCAAMNAPSAGNQQPWQFVVVRDRSLLAQVPAVHPYARMIVTASLAIVVCGDPATEKWPAFWVQDCAAATENLLVEAQYLGLGAVWLGVHPLVEREAGVRRIFGIPEAVVPFAIVVVGYPADTKLAAERYDPARVHRDRW